MFPVAYNIEQFGFNSVEFLFVFFFRSLEEIKFSSHVVSMVLKLPKLVRTEGYDLMELGG